MEGCLSVFIVFFTSMKPILFFIFQKPLFRNRDFGPQKTMAEKTHVGKCDSTVFARSACDPYLFLDVAEGVSNVAFTGQVGRGALAHLSQLFFEKLYIQLGKTTGEGSETNIQCFVSPFFFSHMFFAHLR